MAVTEQMTGHSRNATWKKNTGQNENMSSLDIESISLELHCS